MTKDEIRQRLELVHGAPKRSLGQNFLISSHVISKIIEAAKQTKAESIIEVGPGLGSLTEELLKMDCPLTLVELDRAFSAYWQGRGVAVIEADALKINWSELKKDVLVSNLPYQISASLVIDQSTESKAFRQMILMFQKEVAQRIRSGPSQSSYGMLSVIAQTFWDIDKVTDASPNDFFPAPKVASRVLRFHHKLSPVENKSKYLQFVKAAFQQRRKKLVRSMGTFLNNEKIGLEDFDGLCKKMGLSPTVRAEELNIQQFLNLYHEVMRIKG